MEAFKQFLENVRSITPASAWEWVRNFDPNNIHDLVNLSAGIEWDNGLEVSVYANNIFDENARLSFDRERGGRARQGFNIGSPRTVGVTTRIKFGH